MNRKGKRPRADKGSMDEKENAGITGANIAASTRSVSTLVPMVPLSSVPRSTLPVVRDRRLITETSRHRLCHPRSLHVVRGTCFRRRAIRTPTASSAEESTGTRNREIVDIDTWSRATTFRIRPVLSWQRPGIDHRRLSIAPLWPMVPGCPGLSRGHRTRGGRVTRAFSTHLYSTFGGFASARHLKRSSVPSTMRPLLPRPDRILRDTFGA